MIQKPRINRKVHVRTEGGCLGGTVAKVMPSASKSSTAERLVVAVFTATEPPVKNVTVEHSPTEGWHWYQECPDNPMPKKMVSE